MSRVILDIHPLICRCNTGRLVTAEGWMALSGPRNRRVVRSRPLESPILSPTHGEGDVIQDTTGTDLKIRISEPGSPCQRRVTVLPGNGGSMIRRTALLVACMVLVAVVPAEAFDVNLAVGIDFDGDFDLGSVSLNSNTGYNLGLEIAFKVPIIELGAGLEYGFSREASAADLKASYYQIYAIGRFFIGPAYIAGRFGYANMSVSTILEGDFGAGGSWGLGGGVELFGKLKAELLFNNINTDLKYTTWTIRLLYTF